jgi:hypothetical protein
MRFATIFTLCATFTTILAQASAWPGGACLTDTEANSIANRWLHIWWTGAITNKNQLRTVVTNNVASYDEAFGGPTLSLDELFAVLTSPGPKTTTNVKQIPLQVLHTCDWITTRWQYIGVTTGFNS